MALQDEIKEEQKKVKDMPLKGKIKYIWDYYKIHIIVGIIVIIGAITFIHDVVESSKPEYLGAVVLNTILSYEGDSSDIRGDFARFSDLDLDEYNLTIDTSLHLDLEGGDQMSMAARQKILALYAAGEIDVMLAPEEIINFYAKDDAFADLHQFLNEEEINAFSANGYHVYYATDASGEHAAGFYMDRSPYLKNVSEHGTFLPDDHPVFAFTNCNQHRNATIQFLMMLTQGL